MRKLKVLDLFSGIGGFSLGLERTGFFETVAFCEQDKYCQEVLQKHWKGVKIYDDIKKLEGKEIQDRHGRIDICTGGVPCQPFSVAGKQNGTNDDRYLWPDMFRIIEQLEPTFVIIENVKGLINIQDGMVFETVCSDLESESFEVQAFVIPAAGVGAPHRRERVWIVGYSEYNGSLTTEIERRNFKVNAWTQEREDKTSESERAGRSSNNEIMENSRRTLRQRSSIREKNENEIGEEDANMFKRSSGSSKSDVANTESKSSDSEHNRKKSRETSEQEQIESRRSDSWSLREANWSVEPDVGRVAHGVPGRAHRLKALGNSIVPKIAEEIGRAIVTAKNN
jgi:DNA (cytosine-5)-methyltransferase 1